MMDESLPPFFLSSLYDKKKDMKQQRSHKDHHYNPQFYLRLWENDQQLFYNYFIINHRVKYKLKSAASVGFEPHLYALKKVPREEKNKIEKEVFGDIDNKAALILSKIDSFGINTLSNSEKIEWARFLYSMMSRHPKIIKSMDYPKDEIFDNYKTLPISEQERYKQIHEITKTNSVMIALAAMLTPNNQFGFEYLDNFTNQLLKMFWFVDEFYDVQNGLLTSDNPVKILPTNFGTVEHALLIREKSITNYLASNKFYLYFPISPHKAFFVFPTSRFQPLKDKADIVEFYNNIIAYDATKYVYAKNKSLSDLIEKSLLARHQITCQYCRKQKL